MGCANVKPRRLTTNGPAPTNATPPRSKPLPAGRVVEALPPPPRGRWSSTWAAGPACAAACCGPRSAPQGEVVGIEESPGEWRRWPVAHIAGEGVGQRHGDAGPGRGTPRSGRPPTPPCSALSTTSCNRRTRWRTSWPRCARGRGVAAGGGKWASPMMVALNTMVRRACTLPTYGASAASTGPWQHLEAARGGTSSSVRLAFRQRLRP